MLRTNYTGNNSSFVLKIRAEHRVLDLKENILEENYIRRERIIYKKRIIYRKELYKSYIFYKRRKTLSAKHTKRQKKQN